MQEGADAEQFSVLIPERTLRRGFNRLEFLLLGARRLHRLSTPGSGRPNRTSRDPG